MPFTVLFVCTGNICRSPVAERLFVARLPPSAPVAASSAGTHALAGQGIDPPSAAVLRARGTNPDGHVARRLSLDLLTTADLVLAAGSEHRSVVVQEHPLLFRNAFTMREFARLGADLGPLVTPTGQADAGHLQRRVLRVAERRGRTEPPPPGADDISDPYGRPERARASVDTIADVVDAVIAALGLQRAPTRHGEQRGNS